MKELKDYKSLEMILQNAFATPSQFKLNNIINYIILKDTR